MEHVVGVIAGYPEFVLLDEQLVVFDKVLSSVTRGIHDRRKQVVLVKGGPGTGKSVIAINLMADLMRRGFNAHYATGSKAFTQTLRKVIGARGAGQFKYFNSYTDAPRDEIDALICDEAHRLRESSNDRFHPKKSRPGQMQIDELINAGRVTVFFIDDDQVVRPGEIGSAEHVRDSAKRLACELSEYELEIQFRCGGSDSFVRWIENTLEIKKTPNILWARNEDFDFRIMDSPLTMERAIREKAAEGFRARMMAGFCWPWSKALASDGQLTEDVVIGSYIRPWNAFPEIKKLPKSIPPAPLWANDPEGIGQIGCVYTAQGFEFDYAGVIFGTDLRYSFDKGAWEGHPEDSKDSQVRRAKGGFMDLVKNTYRVLLSRAHKGCYVCFLDKETERFFRSRMERESRPARDEERVADGIVPLGPAQTLFMDALPLLSPEAWDGARKGAKAVPEVIPVPKGKYSGSHFLFRAHENTMRPVIAQGALCLFRKPKQEAVEGRIILLKAEGINEKPTIATLRRRTFLEVREGSRLEKALWIAQYDDPYAQPLLFDDLKSIEILGIFEKVLLP
jgi:hypothetical protein